MPADDLLSDLLAAEDRGQVLGDDELVANCVLLLFAGHETTTNLLANGLYHLLRNPQQLARLRSHPELVLSAVEELLRYDTPVAGTIRVVNEDVELRGRELARGTLVAAMLAAANRDPAQFVRPDELDVSRSPNRHLSYGHGIHFCLGAGLARMEVQITLTALLRRFLRITLLEERPRWKPQVFFRGLCSLPIGLEAGARATTGAASSTAARGDTP
jgi:cytochrome P450